MNKFSYMLLVTFLWLSINSDTVAQENTSELQIIAQEVIDNFEVLDIDGNNYLNFDESIIMLTSEQFFIFDLDQNGILDSTCELPFASGQTDFGIEISIKEETVFVTTSVSSSIDYDYPHMDIARAFKEITAKEYCTKIDRTDDIRVASISHFLDYSRNTESVLLDLDAIAEKIPDFGEYDNTIIKTREMFHKYLLFYPGTYEITYVVDNNTKIQTINIGIITGSYPGCYSCDNWAFCRPIPDDVMDFKSIFNDCLLIILSSLALFIK